MIESWFSSIVVCMLWKRKYQWKWLGLYFSRGKSTILGISKKLSWYYPVKSDKEKNSGIFFQSFCRTSNTSFVKSLQFKGALHIAFRSPGTHAHTQRMDSERHFSYLQSPPLYKLQLIALFIFSVWWWFRRGSKERVVIN